jgi:hypothetical protein
MLYTVQCLLGRFHVCRVRAAMTDPQALADRLEAAIREVDKAQRRGWRLPDGSSADEHLRRLQSDLSRIRAAAVERGGTDGNHIKALIRWITDWIPNPDDRLVSAIGRLAEPDVTLGEPGQG